MNELSWLIYAADVAGDANAVCAFIFYGGCAALAIYSVFKGIAKAITYEFGGDDPVTPSVAKVGKALLLPVVIAGAIGVIAPGRETLYAIAASEMGERVIESETAGKAVAALNVWLDRQISDTGANQ